MPITSRDVARLAGVSQPTVSRALRGDPRVAADTRARVQEAAEALGYVPSEAGRSLVTRRTKRIGIVVSDLTNPFYPHLLGPLHDELEKHSYRMMVFTERSDNQVPLEQLVDGSIDGAVLLTSNLDSRLPAELQRRRLPFVFLNRESSPHTADAAVVDNELGGRLAAAHLTDTGHRRIAGIFGPDTTSTGRDRELGFRAALAESGIALPGVFTHRGPFEFDTGYHAMLELLGTDPRPTAVFCGNDVVAIGALNAAMSKGVGIPDELSLIGFDNIPMAEWEAFRLTTVGHDLDAMAAAAARLLVERLENTISEDRPQRVVLTPQLVERATVAPPPA
ncbi:LacI family transcriptional regulator [Nocardia speluncae]|uniref:LacI family transcriptional regulator n=1 Tax=Nocardia speluncae TaxID=419477 RepID=A0A846X971_9NOCA|nr:LacI family DNA-binding transcriptional regulator [Nocardia speluncae]NKY32538.1 LacI family transcriptional regulator [Nocardia speluncae]